MKTYQNLFLLAGLILSPTAWAYLDPGSGSMLLQVLLGGAAAVGVVAKLYWYGLKRALGFGNKQQDSD